MAPATQATVLLVDDHEIMRDGLREALQRSGDFEVVGEAADGAAAVALAPGAQTRRDCHGCMDASQERHRRLSGGH